MVAAKKICDSINELIVACEVIRGFDADKDYNACRLCPLKDHCLGYCSFEHIAYEVKQDSIDKMLNMADAITERLEERAKTEKERKWEAEADYWNDRRCDPDDEE